MKKEQPIWLGLTIGNSRLHWAGLIGETLQTWDTNHLPAAAIKEIIESWSAGIWPQEILPLKGTVSAPRDLRLYVASVVPTQTELWQAYPAVRIITLDQIPLGGIYPTLGIDRALAVWGAGKIWGWPVLVIDAGTALTFTGADGNHQLVGGAILPGLGLQLKSLGQRTAALPEIELPAEIPQRFALNTKEAMQSGIVYTVIAGVRDFISAWWDSYPESRILLTGGDRTLMFTYLQTQAPEVAAKITVEPNLIFWGMRSIVNIPGLTHDEKINQVSS
ncbi:pantothenate kinase [Microseira sp. BLCC-F43]|uniref:pantothenate kinase n=1 Tax=Microseira sp. BLCC-F43 TaxID=3153602 RepID=UPI0035B922F8